MLHSKYSFSRSKNSSKFWNRQEGLTPKHKVFALKKLNKHKWEEKKQLWLRWEQVYKEMYKYKIQFLIIKHKHAKEYRVVHSSGILITSKEEVLFQLEIHLRRLNL